MYSGGALTATLASKRRTQLRVCVAGSTAFSRVAASFDVPVSVCVHSACASCQRVRPVSACVLSVCASCQCLRPVSACVQSVRASSQCVHSVSVRVCHNVCHVSLRVLSTCVCVCVLSACPRPRPCPRPRLRLRLFLRLRLSLSLNLSLCVRMVPTALQCVIDLFRMRNRASGQ